MNATEQSQPNPARDPNNPAKPLRSEFNCVSCGYTIRGLTVDSLCPECGTPVMHSIASDKPTSGNAIASLVLGIVGILGCSTYGVLSLICGPLAIYFASKARRQIIAGTVSKSSAGLASAGNVTGIIATILGGLIFAFFAVIMIIAFTGITP